MKGMEGGGVVRKWLVCLIALALAACADPGQFGSAALDERAIATLLKAGEVGGVIMTPDGQPAANVLVRAYGINDNPLSVGYRVAAATTTRTDPRGFFVLRGLEGLSLNLEAILDDTLKFFRANVQVSPAQFQNLGKLLLEPTGTILGVVGVEDAGVKDFQGVDVYVPGTSYMGRCNWDGKFTLSHVAVGTYRVVASKAGLGTAEATSVRVLGAQSTNLPRMLLEAHPPVLTALSPHTAGRLAELELTGEDLGVSRGEVLLVYFPGAAPVRPMGGDDRHLRVQVPPDARSGKVLLTRSGQPSNELAFTRLMSLYLTSAGKNLSTSSVQPILIGTSRQLVVRAMTENGQEVVDPVVTWHLDGDSGLERQGLVVSAVRPGDGNLVVASGELRAGGSYHSFGILGVRLNGGDQVLNAPGPRGQVGAGYRTHVGLLARVDATDVDSRRVTWSSSDPSRAVVDQAGVIAAVVGAAAGTATVTARSVDDPTRQASLSVQVTTWGDLDVEVR